MRVFLIIAAALMLTACFSEDMKAGAPSQLSYLQSPLSTGTS